MSIQKITHLEEEDYYKGEIAFNNIRSESHDINSNTVPHLIQVFHWLAKHSPDGDKHPSDEAHNAALATYDKSPYKEIVRKLLQDKTFNTSENVDNLINIGKLLEESINRSKVVSRNDSGGIQAADKSREALWDRSKAAEEIDFATEKKIYPGFTVDRVALLTLSKHINRHAERHYVLSKQTVKTPLSLKIHKGYVYYN
jgi:hypothetical protein